jgi:hypothetical protein
MVERLEIAGRVVALARQAGDVEVTLLGHRLAIVALLESGDIPGLDRQILAFTALAERHRVPVVRWYVPLFAGMRALMRGDLEAALRHCDEGERIGALAGSDNAVMLVGTQRLAVAAEQGNLADFHELVMGTIEPHLARNPTMAGPWALVATISSAVGDLPGTRRALDALTRLDFACTDRDSEWLGTLGAAADAAILLRDTAAAHRVYELIEPYAGRLVVDGIAAACLGAVDDVLARLARLLGRPADARRHADAALALYERVGMPLGAARLRRELDVPPGPCLGLGDRAAGGRRSAGTASCGCSATPVGRCGSPTPRGCTTCTCCCAAPASRCR